MLLVVAILFLVGAIGFGVLIEVANMMSDAPNVRASHWPTIILFAIAAATFAAWWMRW